MSSAIGQEDCFQDCSGIVFQVLVSANTQRTMKFGCKAKQIYWWTRMYRNCLNIQQWK